MSDKIRVLVVDDSTVFRKIVRDSLASIPSVEIVGHAENGAVALAKIDELKPDLVTLDIEMPDVSGIDVLRQIRGISPTTTAIMVSSLTGTGARSTMQALALGAFDFILKPSGADLQQNIQQLQSDFAPKIEALLTSRRPRMGTSKEIRQASPTTPIPQTQFEPQIVVIGTSTGGPTALTRMLPMLPANFPVPILLVQHMPPMFTKTLADDLNRLCKIEVREAIGGEQPQAGQVFIAPGGRHMKAVRTSSGVYLRVTDDEPVLSCRPSVDYLFRSVAKAYDQILAVIMTGMGDDGSRSVQEMRGSNLKVIAQDEASCTVYGMPRAIVEQGNANIVCPLDSIAGAINRTVGRAVLTKSGVMSCN
ncbi:Chemotaxis response regulator protein-glutamate methylesterase [Rubripirellula tenax]|uniref:Protein-glutamate methylesterase/protein-glutamine glutaminase n=1 Tax=Rubripirellula tenax TaxID=2528015 RepID=A0A5C6FDR9_9BACT|nr:chemotaxis response regulator protein-glutamate methylesterase [Rubripirellula tenax]TWU58740.1 Chemotaxis response regulator protein-glutamate methylesterase [Rubripirellula tenax]